MDPAVIDNRRWSQLPTSSLELLGVTESATQEENVVNVFEIGRNVRNDVAAAVDDDVDNNNVDDDDDEEELIAGAAERNEELLSTLNGDFGETFRRSMLVRTVSTNCMQSYKSALLWYYDEHGILWSDESNKFCESFIDGYQKIVQAKREDGVMNINEGTKAVNL